MKVGPDVPSQTAIAVNAAELAMYARTCQVIASLPSKLCILLLEGI